jgi:peptidylprolyl isomerase
MALAAVISAPFVLASCIDTNVTIPDEVPIEQTTFAPALGVDLAASTKTGRGAYYRDIVVGTGAAVTNGKRFNVYFTGWLANGTAFDSNVGGDVFPVILGGGQVIDGWEETLVGTKVGGTRQLIIPPSLGFGPYPYGDLIPGNSVLVFNVQVVSIDP